MRGCPFMGDGGLNTAKTEDSMTSGNKRHRRAFKIPRLKFIEDELSPVPVPDISS